MRIPRFALILAILLPLAGVGCQPLQPPGGATTQPVAQATPDPLKLANDFSKSAIQTATAFHKAGFISDADWQNIALPAIDAVSNALDAWEAHQNDAEAEKQRAVFDAVLPNLLEIVLNTQHKKAAAHAAATTRRAA